MIIPRSSSTVNTAINDYEFIAIADNTTTFTIDPANFNFASDRLDIFYQGMRLEIADNYSLADNVVTLGFAINIGDTIRYTVTKTL